MPRRQSPVALLFIFGRVLREFWPLFLLLVGRRFFGSDVKEGVSDPISPVKVILGLAATFLLLGLYFVVEYLRFRFSIGNGELTVSSGVFFRKKTGIPLENVQSVHLKQNYINRLTDTYGLKVETAGTDGEEFDIKALGREEALALQEILQHGRAVSIPGDARPPEAVIDIRPGELFKLAFSENHVKTLLVIMAFAFARLDDLRYFFGKEADNMLDDRMAGVEWAGRSLALLVGTVAALTLAVSFFRVWLRYHGMELRIGEGGFRMQWGFLQTQRKLLQHDKVQMVSWSSNLLRELLGIRILRFFMAGEANVGRSEQWIRLPVMREEALRDLTAAYRTGWPSSVSAPYRVHPSYAWRPTLLVVLPLCMAGAAALTYWQPGLLWIPPLALAYEAVTNAVRHRKFRFWHDNETLQVEGGVWGWEHTLLNFERVQHVVVKTSPFLRSRGLANLVLHTAGKTVKLPYIPIGQANGLADLCLFRVEFECERQVTMG
jgi:putative membrane protein